MNQPIAHAFVSHPDASSSDSADGLEPIDDVPVGDVVIRQDDSGYAIYNYRGERILDRPIRTAAEAHRVAADIVSPWQGHVHLSVGST